MRRDIQEIFRATPHSKQVMMFSATLSKEIRPVCKKFMQDVIIALGWRFLPTSRVFSLMLTQLRHRLVVWWRAGCLVTVSDKLALPHLWWCSHCQVLWSRLHLAKPWLSLSANHIQYLTLFIADLCHLFDATVVEPKLPPSFGYLYLTISPLETGLSLYSSVAWSTHVADSVLWHLFYFSRYLGHHVIIIIFLRCFQKFYQKIGLYGIGFST